MFKIVVPFLGHFFIYFSAFLFFRLAHEEELIRDKVRQMALLEAKASSVENENKILNRRINELMKQLHDCLQQFKIYKLQMAQDVSFI